ncbi:SusC/RagA family TonB-linked outer membrane protein [Dinghuibacter silviterrae]|uniref:TonB-linked SusC/RagA family outer membrane protein n=1 Tax=Dinghuibacter silviterrae TaxID=1539049 RepID=A0A4R8DF99_9BACT|nr:SusC/RagA family TonB-linked outer membrane protein [Dinghuibacter silviterrae]TDW95978.1 TonB-linked SusC/RagA family outer membrane protein [Dinghuibacter silviterrae]
MKPKLDCLRGWLLLLATLISISSYAQTRITGKVIAASSKLGVPGATVQVVGAKVAAVTDGNGVFSLTLPAGRTRLDISSIGYQDQTVTLSGTEVTVTLVEKSNTLNEVVVTGYTTQRKKDLTGAVAVVDLTDAKKQPVPDAVNMLQGQASGVSVVSSGEPGQSPVIHIRGFNSFGNNSPLFVIDGVPTQSVSDINTADIATMQVLKDAGAASIYGSRASNGVIIITTRKGSGRVKITYDGFYGTQQPKGGNAFHILNPTDEGTLLYQAQTNYNTLNPSSPTTLGNAIYGSGASPVLPDYLVNGTLNGVAQSGGFASGSPAVNPSLEFADPTGANYYQIAKANKTGTDWYHELFKPAQIQSHNLSVSGATDQGSYLMSLSYFDQEGTMIETYLKRYTIRANATYNFTSRIRVGENMAYSSTQNPQSQSGTLVEGSPIGFAMRENPIIPVYDIGGNFAGSAPKGLNNPRNPVALQYNTRNDRGQYQRIFGNVWGEADVLKNLTFRTSFGGEYYSDWNHQYQTPDFYNAEPQYTIATYLENGYNGGDWTWTNTLTYNLVKGDHSLKVIGGIEAYDFINHNYGGSTQGYFTNDPNFVNLTSGYGTSTNYSNSNNLPGYSLNSLGGGESLFSYIGRVDYAYKDRYLIGGTFRRDGSSKFPDNQYSNFPAVSAGWRVSQEDFLKSVRWLTELKIRGSWGIMGNQFNALDANAYTLYGANKQTTYYPIGGGAPQLGLSVSQIGNPAAKWESDVNSNIGFDMTLFQGKLSITADYYAKTIKDLLYATTLIGTQGAATVPAYNVGRMTNNGIDIMISGQTNITRDLQFNGTLTFTTFHNVIKQIDASGDPYFDLDGRRFNGSYIIRNEVGHPVSAFYGYKIAGFWNSQAQITAADQAAQKASAGAVTQYQPDEGVGRFRYEDGAHQGYITANSKEFLGNPNPKFNLGSNLGLSYKNFDFSVFLYWVYGNDIWNNVKWWTDFYASFPGAASSQTALYDSWTFSKQSGKAPIQDAINGSNASTNTVPNSYFVEKGSYLRAKNMTLGYTLNPTRLSRIGITRCRIYVQAINLFTVTKYSGLDPEISVNTVAGTNGMAQNSTTDFGIDEGAYANPRQYLLGLQLTF